MTDFDLARAIIDGDLSDHGKRQRHVTGCLGCGGTDKRGTWFSPKDEDARFVHKECLARFAEWVTL